MTESNHPNVESSVCKMKISEYASNMFDAECNNSSLSCTDSLTASTFMEERSNSETADIRISDANNSNKNVPYISFGRFDFASLTDVKKRNTTDTTAQTLKEIDTGNFYISDHEKQKTSQSRNTVIECDENGWVNISLLSDDTPINENPSIQQDVKQEIIGRAYENETFKKIDILEFTERTHFYPFRKIIGICLLSVINLNIFRKRNHRGVETESPSVNANFTYFNHSNARSKESNWKGISTKHADANDILVSQRFETRSKDIRTLEDALNYFELSALVEQLDKSLEEVRRSKKSKKDHEDYLKDVDKKLLQLSLKFHPDKVRNKGGSEEEIENAHTVQAAINAVRVALNVLNNVFLKDIFIDHRFEFYKKLDLSSAANEKKVKNNTFDVMLKIFFMSEIKREVFVEIKYFLAECKNCLRSYFLSEVTDFQKYRDSAFFYLDCCMKGFEKLHKELKVIENECKVEKLDIMSSAISRMVIENRRTLTYLHDLKSVVRKSLDGSLQIFTTSERLDEYLLQPFVDYVNVILLCNVMIKSQNVKLNMKERFFDFKALKIHCIEDLYYLVSNFIIGRKKHRIHFNLPINTREKELRKESKEKLRKELKEKFDIELKRISNNLEDTFKESGYQDNSMENFLSEQVKELMKMMFDLQAKEKELSKDMEEFKKEIANNHEENVKIMKEREEFKKIIKERLEKCNDNLNEISLRVSNLEEKLYFNV